MSDDLVGSVWYHKRNDYGVEVVDQDSFVGIEGVEVEVVDQYDEYRLDDDDPRIGEKLDLTLAKLQTAYRRVDETDDGVENRDALL